MANDVQIFKFFQNFREEDEIDFKVAIKKLTEGFLKQYQEQWEQSGKKLNEVK